MKKKKPYGPKYYLVFHIIFNKPNSITIPIVLYMTITDLTREIKEKKAKEERNL